MPPKASPTKTSSWRKRLRTSFIGNRGRRGGALEGAPEKDQRFAYLKYDS
jgi:hypothetical protein